jgi:hypothetical protein
MQLKEIKRQMTKLNFSQIPKETPEGVKMTPFHLNETVCFDQNGLFWYKTMLFRPTQKKGCQTACRVATVYHLQHFVPEKLLR